MLDDKRALVLAADLFEDVELLYPVHRLAEEGIDVTIAGLSTEPVTGKKGHGLVPVDTTVDRVSAGDFDALVIPVASPWTSCAGRRRCSSWCGTSTLRASPWRSSATPAGFPSRPAS